MNILRLQDGFVESRERHNCEFFRKLERLIEKQVCFKGNNEPGAFHVGILKSFGEETVTFSTSDATRQCEWTYPLWEVMIAVAVRD